MHVLPVLLCDAERTVVLRAGSETQSAPPRAAIACRSLSRNPPIPAWRGASLALTPDLPG